jgi:hypothetical protein
MDEPWTPFTAHTWPQILRSEEYFFFCKKIKRVRRFGKNFTFMIDLIMIMVVKADESSLVVIFKVYFNEVLI